MNSYFKFSERGFRLLGTNLLKLINSFDGGLDSAIKCGVKIVTALAGTLVVICCLPCFIIGAIHYYVFSNDRDII